MQYLRERRAALGGSLPARRRKAEPLQVPGAVGLPVAARRQRRARDLDDDGVRAGARHAAARQADRQAGGPDRARRVAHVRHGGHVPPGRRVLAGRSALQARGLRAAHVLPRGQGRTDPRGGHHRGRLDVLVHRRRHLVQHPRRADDPVLHLLLDVRVPARRRSGLGRGRQPRPRLPARRHRRTHDAQRRGSPARGRPQPRAVLGRTELSAPTTRPSATRSR